MTTAITDHVSDAADLIHDMARATVSAAWRPRKTLAHIDAAQFLMVAASELFTAAEEIASGKPVHGHGAALGPDASYLAVSLRVAEAKLAEAKRMLARA